MCECECVGVCVCVCVCAALVLMSYSSFLKWSLLASTWMLADMKRLLQSRARLKDSWGKVKYRERERKIQREREKFLWLDEKWEGKKHSKYCSSGLKLALISLNQKPGLLTQTTVSCGHILTLFSKFKQPFLGNPCLTLSVVRTTLYEFNQLSISLMFAACLVRYWVCIESGIGHIYCISCHFQQQFQSYKT